MLSAKDIPEFQWIIIKQILIHITQYSYKCQFTL